MTSPRPPAPPSSSASSTAISASAPSSASPRSGRPTISASSPLIACAIITPTTAATPPPCSAMSPPRRRGSPPPISPPASSMACSIRDNIAITAQSFDYGPWRFTPFWDGDFTAAYFDHAGPLQLRPPARGDPLGPRPARSVAADHRRGRGADARSWSPSRASGRPLRDASFARLGVAPGELADDIALVTALEEALAAKTVDDRPLLFRLARRVAGRSCRPLYERPLSTRFAGLSPRHGAVPGALDHPYWSDPAPARCISRRSRRSGPRSTSATIGRRSTPRSPRSAGWARRHAGA